MVVHLDGSYAVPLAVQFVACWQLLLVRVLRCELLQNMVGNPVAIQVNSVSVLMNFGFADKRENVSPRKRPDACCL